jgi:hypothetical protein
LALEPETARDFAPPGFLFLWSQVLGRGNFLGELGSRSSYFLRQCNKKARAGYFAARRVNA